MPCSLLQPLAKAVTKGEGYEGAGYVNRPVYLD